MGSTLRHGIRVKEFRPKTDCYLEGWVGAIAVVGSAVIGAAGSITAANKQASAQKQAAQTQADMFNTIVGQEQPYMTSGNAAQSRLDDLLGTSSNTSAAGYGSLTSTFTPADYLANQDPGYQFQLATGAQALRNADTPGVGSLSGAALKDLMSFNQGMAATGYQNAYNRYMNSQGAIYGRLSDVANRGQNAASNTGQQGTALAGNEGAALAGAGATTSSGYLGVTNALAKGANTAAGYYAVNGGGSNTDYAGLDNAYSNNAADLTANLNQGGLANFVSPTPSNG